YGPKILFDNTDWLVTPNERAGIVGSNGTGKSTLLKVLAGMEGLDSGSLATQKGVTIGYLPQEADAFRAERIRRVHDGLRQPAGARRRAGTTRAQDGGSGPRRPRVRPGGGPFPSRGERIPRARR